MANEMKAGRDLDKAVAEAMGWRDLALADVAALFVSWTGKAPDSEYRRLVPRFSTDVAAAWHEVWPWLVERVGIVHIAGDMEEWDERHPVVVDAGGVRVMWHSMPEALCRAVLLIAAKEAPGE